MKHVVNYDHVDGVSKRLWTAATSGSIVHLPGYVYMSMENHGGMTSAGVTSYSSTELSGNPTSSHLLATQQEVAMEMIIFALLIIAFILHTDLQHVVKSFDMGPMALFPLRRKSRYRFLWPLEIHSLRSDLTPRTLGPMANKLTTIPPRTKYS
jgi:hypothetical protein